jgi:nucleoid DNA-binding protein
MSNKLSIQDLASAYAEKSGTDQKSALAFVKTVFEIVEEFISTDKVVKIKGFGTFKLISVSDRESVNVNTGERIVIAGHTKLSFTPDTPLRDAVNRPFADFETTPINDSTPLEAMEKLPSQNEELPSGDSSEDYAEEQNLVVVEETVLDEPFSPESPTSYDESVETVANAEDERVGEDLQVETKEEVLPVETKEEAMPVETNEEAMPVDTKEEVLSVIPVHKPNDDNPSYPMSEEPIAEPVSGKAGKSHTWLYVCLCLILMAASYVCGHYRLLDKVEVALYSDSEEVHANDVSQQDAVKENAAPTVSADSCAECDTLRQDSVPVADKAPAPASRPEEDPAEIAKYFPQVPGGEYWIVGDAGYVHHMQVGETLYRIAGKELGNQNLVRYLIVFNKFEDPNIIHTGDPIRIPKLVKKEQSGPTQVRAE